MKNNFIFYLLVNKFNNRTFSGVTDNLEKTLLIHNSKQKNTNNYTKKYIENGKWEIFLMVKNLYKYQAYDILRNLEKKKGKGKTNIEKRMDILSPILNKFKSNIYYA